MILRVAIAILHLPINGRNWMELTLLAPGSRSNDVSSTSGSLGNFPVSGNSSAGSFQLNLRVLDVEAGAALDQETHHADGAHVGRAVQRG